MKTVYSEQCPWIERNNKKVLGCYLKKDEKELTRLIVRLKDDQKYAKEIAIACCHRAEDYDVKKQLTD